MLGLVWKLSPTENIFLTTSNRYSVYISKHPSPI